MKKILLSLGMIATAIASSAQVSCVGISPVSIEGDYTFEWADPDGGDWATPDFTVPNTYVQDTLALVDDGTPGLNPQGNPIAAEGCNALVNGPDVDGKIAVIYRNTCEFGAKALNAQNAGAVAVIIINRDNEAIPMGGGADGGSVNIPVIMLSSSDGASLVTEMENGPVVMFLGNKVGLNANDIGLDRQFSLGSPYGGANINYENGFDLGVQFINFGNNDQPAVTANAIINGPSGVVYDETVGPLALSSTDTLAIFDQFTNSFPPFSLGTYELGDYTLTYTLNIVDSVDEDPNDNTQTFTFSINDEVLSRSSLDASNEPVANTYPTNGESEFQSCMFIEEPNASVLGITGVYFVPNSDTSGGFLATGEEILINVTEWFDGWADLDELDENSWADLSTVTSASYTIGSEAELGNVQYVELNEAVRFEDNVRYLICAQTFTPNIEFGYDNTQDYRGNSNVRRMPIGSLYTTDANSNFRWYTGYTSGIAPSIAAKVSLDVSIDENAVVEGYVSPNPATDVVRISVNAEGNAQLVIADLSGKIVQSSALEMNNGVTHVNIANLENGMYIFNVTMENGQTAKFNVVKE